MLRAAGATAIRSLLLPALVVGPVEPVHGQDAGAVITLQDRVTILVEGQPEVSGQYEVEPDGSILLDLIGPVEVVGLSAPSLADVLEDRLSVYVREPRVEVAIERPELVFIFGAVQQPGTYERTRDLTILELLVRAGYSGVSEVMVVRRKGARLPVLPDSAAESEVLRVNLRELEREVEEGDLSRNVVLEPGDTVFVPDLDANAIYVTGEVRNPGPYSVADETTVVQVLTLAGWLTERASIRGVRVVRLEDGRQRELRARLEDRVRPGDTVLVRERYSYPTFRAWRPAVSDAFRIGRAVTIAPSLGLARFGTDSNVFDLRGERENDFVVQVTPRVDLGLDLRRVRLDGTVTFGGQHYRRLRDERAVSWGYDADVEVDLARPITLTGGYGFRSARDRLDEQFELEARVRHEVHEIDAGARLGPWGRLSFDVSMNDRRMTIPRPATFAGEALEATLSNRIRSASAGVNLALTQGSTLDVSYTAAAHRFPLSPSRNADRAQVTVGLTFDDGALVSGRAYAGLFRYSVFDSRAADREGLHLGGELWHTFRDRTEVGVRGQRSIASPFQSEVAFSLFSQYGAWVRQGLSRRFDVMFGSDSWRYSHQRFERLADEAEADGLPSRSPGRFPRRRVRYIGEIGMLLGASRVGLQAVYERRDGVQGYDNLSWGVIYNRFGVRW